MNASNRPDPMVEEALHKLLAAANLARIRGQLDVAEDKCAEALKIAPASIEAMEMTGDLLYERGKLEDALQRYKTAIDLLSTPSLETKYAKVALEIGDRDRQRQVTEMMLAQPQTYTRRKRSPVTAFFLSFLVPGWGQIYNGELVKGLILMATVGLCSIWMLSSPYFTEMFRSLLTIFVAGEVSRAASASSGGTVLFPAMVVLCCWLYGIIDAPRVASLQSKAGKKTGFEE